MTIAGGSRRLVPYVGPLTASFADRRCFVDAMVLGPRTLGGGFAMGDLEVVIRPGTRDRAVISLANPFLAGSIAMRCRRR